MFQTNYVGGQPQIPVTDTVFTNITITGAQKSGDAFDAKSGFGIWANELPEAGQGPAVGSVTFNNLHAQQQLRGHPEHDHDLHHHPQLTHPQGRDTSPPAPGRSPTTYCLVLQQSGAFRSAPTCPGVTPAALPPHV